MARVFNHNVKVQRALKDGITAAGGAAAVAVK